MQEYEELEIAFQLVLRPMSYKLPKQLHSCLPEQLVQLPKYDWPQIVREFRWNGTKTVEKRKKRVAMSAEKMDIQVQTPKFWNVQRKMSRKHTWNIQPHSQVLHHLYATAKESQAQEHQFLSQIRPFPFLFLPLTEYFVQQ